MNRLRILLLYPCIVAPLYAMEQVASISSDYTFKNRDLGRVPSLKKMVLTQIASSLVQQNNKELLAKLTLLYPGAAADCAQMVADDQRVLLWNICGKVQHALKLDHDTPLQAYKPEDQADAEKALNRIIGALFTTDHKYLITIAFAYECRSPWVAFVWRMADIEEIIRHASVSENTLLDTDGSIKAPLKPCNEFVLAKKGLPFYIHQSIQMRCDPSSSIVMIPFHYDCIVLKLGPDGELSNLWRLNLSPRAQIQQVIEGSVEEQAIIHELCARGLHLNTGCAEFNTTGTHLLLHIRNSTGVERGRRGKLYCIPIAAGNSFKPRPIINGLDESYCIADDVCAAQWRTDDNIFIIDTHKTLRTIDITGIVLEDKELQLIEMKKEALLPFTLQFVVARQRLIIRGGYHFNTSHAGSRIDMCDISTGICEWLHQNSNNGEISSLPTLTVENHTTPHALHCFPGDRYILKVFKGGDYKGGEHTHGIWAILWDLTLNRCADIVQLVKFGRENYFSTFSADGSYLFIADQAMQGEEIRWPARHSTIFPLKTPGSSEFTLEELLVLAKIHTQGIEAVLADPDYAQIYATIGSSSNQAEILKGAVHRYFKKLH